MTLQNSPFVSQNNNNTSLEGGNLDLKLFSKLQQRFRILTLGSRLTFYFVSIGFIFTLVTVGVLLLKQYDDGRVYVYDEAKGTIEAVNQQLARSLWNVDQDSTHILLEGVYRMPSIQGVRIIESLGNEYQYGEVKQPASLSSPLIFNDQNMGRIEVDVQDELIEDSVRQQFIVIFLSSTLTISLISFVFSYIIKNAVIKHLSAISAEISHAEKLTSKTHQPITLDRPDFHDELSDLVNALNQGRKQVAEFALAKESYENQLEYQANFDVLTSLPNRRHIETHLKEEMLNQQATNKNGKLVIFFIDLDGFKEVNDSLGHSSGDKILLDSALRLKNLITQYSGYVARFGGDEFIASFMCKTRTEAENVANQIIQTFQENFILNDAQLQLGCSIGVAMYPEDGDTTEDLIRKADTAMYKAKASGRNTFSFFDQTMLHDIILHNTIKNKLKMAMANNQLELYYQPLINLTDMSITGFEALLRWHDDDLGQVGPDLFIPIAEKSGLIFDIDIWVFEHAIDQVKKWRADFNADYIVSINFSPTNFHHREIDAWTSEHKIFLQSLDWVELEVTERLMLDNDPIVMKGINQLLKSGLHFSIDDFGTGYSSLGYIQKFSHILSKIKIDRMFVNEIINSSSDQALVKSIITLADSLSIEVLAEGIEAKKQEETLVELGCGYAQGFFYSKPIPISKIPDFIYGWNKTPHIVKSN